MRTHEHQPQAQPVRGWPWFRIDGCQQCRERLLHPTIDCGGWSESLDFAARLRRDRRAEDALQRSDRVVKRPAKALLPGSREKPGPKSRLGAQGDQQLMQIDEVAEASVEIGIEEQVYSRVQHAVRRREQFHIAVTTHFGTRPERSGIWAYTAHRRTDCVMDVDAEHAPRVVKRGDF